ncbi:MAG TPA: DUF6049 family protein [Actinomycetales bacterium]|nr:DUF6049 family protein [Actinomycetales bacterium]
MRPHAGTPAARLALRAVWLVLLLAALLVGGLLPVPAAHATDRPPAQIALTSVTPVVAGPTAEVKVSGRITNVGDRPITYLTARLHVLRDRLGTRFELESWLRGDGPTGPVEGRTVDLYLPDSPGLRPGDSVPFTLTLNQVQLGLTGAAFGSYGLAVEARGQVEGPRTDVGLVRTALVWAPGDERYVPQQVSWLVPFTGPLGGVRAGDPTLQQVAAAVEPGSRLRHLLEAASAPSVGWAVDPALLRTLADASGQTSSGATSPATTAPTSSGVSTPESETTSGTPTTSASPTVSPTDADDLARAEIRDFLTAMRKAAHGRTVLELPYGDPDVQAVADAGQPQLLHGANALGAGTVQEVLGVPAATDVAWPAAGWADDRALQALSGDDTTAVVLDSRSRPLTDPLGYTPDARAELPYHLQGWLFDAPLSGLASQVRSGDALTLQRVLAHTAALTTERPGLARRLLITLPRGADPDPAAFRTLVAAVAAAPWVTTVAPADLRQALPRGDTSSLQRRPVSPPTTVATTAISTRDVLATHDLRSDLAALAEVLTSPAEVTLALQRSALGLLSCEWRGHPSELAARRAAVTKQVHALVGRLHVLPTRANFLATNASLPFTVANGLDQTVTGLRLKVTAPNPRLEVRQDLTDPFDVAAGTRVRVQVPVRAIAAGRVSLTAQLVTPSGRELGDAVSVQVRTQPPGTWVMWVVAAAVGLVLLVGLVRAVRRPRRKVVVPHATSGETDDGTPT